MTDSSTILSIRNLAVSISQQPLFEGIGLDIAPGEMIALTGPSGCGKTSLFHAVTGLRNSWSGTISLHGRSPSEIGWPRFRRKVTLVQQRPVVLQGTVQTNLEKPFEYATSNGKPSEADQRAILEAFGLHKGVLKQDVSELSGGELQRVCLTRALLLKPSIILLDEPTSSLDPDTTQLVADYLSHLITENRLAGMIVTHSHALSDRLCNRRLAIRDFTPTTATHKGT